MTTAFWCVLIAGLLPYVAIVFAKGNKKYLQEDGNRSPREWEARLVGRPQRAHAAHLNGFEAFPLFAAGVIIATLCKAAPSTIDTIAITFVVARIAYLFAYLADIALLRSLIWMVGVGCSVSLFIVASRAGGGL